MVPVPDNDLWNGLYDEGSARDIGFPGRPIALSGSFGYGRVADWAPRHDRTERVTMSHYRQDDSDPDVQVSDLGDLAWLETAWLDLQARSGCSFFQSWGWIGCWLRLLPPAIRPRSLVLRQEGRVIALGVLIPNEQRRHHVIRSAGLFLNETGLPAFDSLTIEYNGLLTENGISDLAARHALRWLVEQDRTWEELYLSGLGPEQSTAYSQIAGVNGLHVWLRKQAPAYLVDLDSVRREGGDYLGVLGSNTRYQIRRTVRLYEKTGGIEFQLAHDVEQALDFFDALKSFHQTYWTNRSQPGSFANRTFEEFHRALIKERFASGQIQLARISVPRGPIGYLYNFVMADRVYAYQSGFKYEQDPKIKPGLACHYLAIQYNLNKGIRYYDFLAGENQQKKTMSTDHYEMTWLTLQRAKPKFIVERALRRVKHLGST